MITDIKLTNKYFISNSIDNLILRPRLFIINILQILNMCKDIK